MQKNTSEYIIGLDIGTGSTKAIAMDRKGTIIASDQVFYSMNEPHPGYSEQDPEIICKAFTDCIKKITGVLPYPPRSVCLSSAMHGVLVIDKNHQVLTPLITWADTRSGAIAEHIRNLPEAEEIYKSSGTPIHSMSPLTKIIWLKENQPEIFKASYKFISIKEFIWFQLFGVYEVDYSIASATGLFNIGTLEWNDLSLKLCNISSGQLSKPVATDFIRENLNPGMEALLHLPADTSFCIGASDGCLANIGSYAIEKGTAALTIGTSGAVRIAHAQPIFNFPGMTFNYVLDKSTFICGGPVNNGGNIIDWLFETFLHISSPAGKDFEQLFTSIESVPPGSRGLIFLPYLYGERAPVWDERSSGVFFGIQSFHTTASFLRAAIEGICYSMNQVLELIETSTERILQVNAGGGFIHSKTWLKILADITGKKIFVIETEDSSAVGAAILNMKAISWIEEYSSLQPENKMIIEPDPKIHALYQKKIAVFTSLYPALKQAMHQLHENNAPIH